MRSSKVLVTCIASLIPALGVSVAHAQAGDSARSDERSSSSGHEKLSSKEFVKRAAQANLAEIKVSELAQSKAQSADVKQFAQQMITDHTKASAELSKIATAKGIKVPDDTDMMHKASMKMLQGKSGESFDKSYMEHMDKDHQKAIELFQSAASSADVDPELKAFASKTLPKLQEHHHLVAQVEAKQPSASASAGSSSSKR
jgi:putative membrane protein